MRLKKLELHGFKSFANKTEIVFESGITGIVGPNGCGKSNIVDAIKWVLGTLSYKSIRGDEMMDVVFKGAEGVAPMGMAEVTLTLLNDDKHISLEYEEITLSRRLYSSGESEYMINKSPCRLKDIRELLYGTGIGVDDYSIIEQGKIDKLILSNPRERRAVFDEAAGVSRYKAKKREAESKLEKVNNDMLRLGDVVREVAREMRSIKIQAGRASRYREVQEQMKQKQLTLIHHQISDFKQTRDRLRGEIEASRAKIEELTRELQDLSSGIQGDTGRLKELDQSIHTIQSTLVTLESRILSLTDILGRGRSRQEELTMEREAGQSELKSIEEKRRVMEAEREELAKALAAAREERAKAERDLEESNRAVADAVRECASLQDRIERTKSEIIELMRKEAQYRNELSSVQSEQNALGQQLNAIRGKKIKFDEEKAAQMRQLVEFESAVQVLERNLQELRDSKTLEETIGSKLKEKVQHIIEGLMTLRERREKVVSRLDMMKDLERQMDGLEAAAKALLHYNGGRFPGIMGTVADLIEVDRQHVPVLESSLGERAGYLVAEDLDKARDAMTYVRTNRLGRVAIVIADLMSQDTAAPASPEHPSPLEFIHCDPRYHSVMERLLGHIRVADHLDQALEWIRNGHRRGPVVTRQGDLIAPEGIVVSAAVEGVDPAHGILSRRTEIRDLMMESDVVSTELERTQNQKIELEKMSVVSEEKLDLIRKSIYEKYTHVLEKNSECEQVRKRIQFLNEEEKVFAIEIQQLEGRLRELEEKTGSLGSVLKEVEELHGRLTGEISAHEETLKRYETEKARLDEENAALRVSVARVAEKETALQERGRVLESDLQDVTGRIDRASEQQRQLDARAQALIEEMSLKQKEFERAGHEKEAVRTELDQLTQDRDGCAEELGRRQARQQEMMTGLKSYEEAAQMVKLQESQAAMKLENIMDRAQREYELQIDPDGIPGETQEGQDWAALEKEVEELRSRMQSMGPVNLLALDRLNELEERHKFLDAQMTDLNQSKTQLEELILKINKESRELFEKTLATVRENFSAIFRKLFGGGRAEIILEEGEGVDPFEAGLEIMAKLPQKEATVLSLLSGGEKSLTALSLVMALFKVNPSPFCVLDESDAALDEKNVVKYVGLIHEFIEETQFIVITHNKRTMAMADILYGITMERPGVSKVVTVSLNKANAMTGNSTPAEPAVAAAVAGG